MASTLVRFRLAGIPVRVRPWFVVMVALGGLPRGWAGGAIWFAVVTASVLWHELGHALTMKAFGDEPWIELDAMGGRAHWPAGANPSPREALLVIAAGPVAGLALGAAAWALSQATGPLPFLAELALRDAVWVNVWWSLFNLLPMLPLDGAQLLDQVSRLQTGRREPVWVGVLSVAAGGAVVALAAQRRPARRW